MEYRRLGSSGLEVSVVCLGTMMFGDRTDAAQANEIAAHAFANGINFIDTADVYSNGASESITGAAIRAQRSTWILATKVGNPMAGEGNAPPHQLHPADAGQRTDLRAAGPGHEGRGQHGDSGGEVLRPGTEVCREDQGDDGHGVGDGGHEQDAALAEPVGEDAQDWSAQCGTDADGSGGGAAHGVGARDGGDERQGADGEHGQRQAGEESQRDETAAGEQRQPRKAAALGGRGGRQCGSRNEGVGRKWGVKSRRQRRR